MNTNALLEQLLKSGQSLLQQKTGGQGASGGLGGLTDLLGGKGSQGLGGMLSGFGGKAAAAGALSVLLGNKKLGKVASYGGLAALGMMAYKAYNNWQAQQGNTATAQAPQTIDRLAPAEQEAHSSAILRAIIAAAKADGHVDEREKALIEQEFANAEDPALKRWLQAELNKPLDPAEVAQGASTPEMAAEMYLASLIMVDDEHFMERAYLDELAKHLKLAPELVEQLRAQARQG